MTVDDIAYARKIIVKLEEAYNSYYNTSEGMPYDIDETLRNAKFCIKDSLYYISRKEAEIEKLNEELKNLTSDLTSSRAEIERLHNILLSFTNEVHNWSNKKGYDTTELSLIPILNEAASVRETIKAEAIKDFADRLVHTLVINNLVNTGIFDYSYTLKTIDNLAKEMIEEKR